MKKVRRRRVKRMKRTRKKTRRRKMKRRRQDAGISRVAVVLATATSFPRHGLRNLNPMP